MDYKTSRSYYISYINMIKTAKYRGYDLPENVDCALDIEGFIEIYGKSSVNDMKKAISKIIFDTININYQHIINPKGDANVKMALIWHSEYKMGIGIRDVINKLEEMEVKKAMIVVDGGITPGCREILGNIRKTKSIIVDIWTLDESMLFVPDHVLVPHHEICSMSKKREVLKSYGIKLVDARVKLPNIKHNSTMVKYLGAKKGQLIKIIRPCETDPDSMMETYRIVV